MTITKENFEIYLGNCDKQLVDCYGNKRSPSEACWGHSIFHLEDFTPKAKKACGEFFLDHTTKYVKEGIYERQTFSPIFTLSHPDAYLLGEEPPEKRPEVKYPEKFKRIIFDLLKGDSSSFPKELEEAMEHKHEVAITMLCHWMDVYALRHITMHIKRQDLKYNWVEAKNNIEAIATIVNAFELLKT